MRMIIPHSSPVLHGIVRARILAPLAVLAAALGGAQLMGAQTPPPARPAPPAHKPVPQHKPSSAARGSSRLQATQASNAAAPSAPAHKPVNRQKPAAEPPAETPTPQAAEPPAKPLEPEAPAWPANEKPAQAAITWDAQGLRIEAANSSLQQIMQDVAALTGVKVEGLETDERVFGEFGPGQARDVLSQLLQGSSYNVLMIGDQGQGTPRQILLTARNAAPKTTAANQSPSTVEEETEPEEQPQPQPRPPARPFGPGGRRGPNQLPPEMRQPGQPGENPPSQ
jgi:hypothetical protein